MDKGPGKIRHAANMQNASPRSRDVHCAKYIPFTALSCNMMYKKKSALSKIPLLSPFLDHEKNASSSLILVSTLVIKKKDLCRECIDPRTRSMKTGLFIFHAIRLYTLYASTREEE
jgi:hypothetical protein